MNQGHTRTKRRSGGGSSLRGCGDRCHQQCFHQKTVGIAIPTSSPLTRMSGRPRPTPLSPMGTITSALRELDSHVARLEASTPHMSFPKKDIVVGGASPFMLANTQLGHRSPGGRSVSQHRRPAYLPGGSSAPTLVRSPGSFSSSRSGGSSPVFGGVPGVQGGGGPPPRAPPPSTAPAPGSQPPSPPKSPQGGGGARQPVPGGVFDKLWMEGSTGAHRPTQDDLMQLLEARATQAEAEVEALRGERGGMEAEMHRLAEEVRHKNVQLGELEREVEEVREEATLGGVKWEMKLKSLEGQLKAARASVKSSGAKVEDAAKSVDGRVEDRIAAVRKQEKERSAIAVAEALAERERAFERGAGELKGRIALLQEEVERLRVAHVKALSDSDAAVAAAQKAAAAEVEVARAETQALRGRMQGTTALLKSALHSAPTSPSPSHSSPSKGGKSVGFKVEGGEEGSTFAAPNSPVSASAAAAAAAATAAANPSSGEVQELHAHLASLLEEIASVRAQVAIERQAWEASESVRVAQARSLRDMKEQLTLALVALAARSLGGGVSSGGGGVGGGEDDSSKPTLLPPPHHHHIAQWVEGHVGASKTLLPMALESLEYSMQQVQQAFFSSAEGSAHLLPPPTTAPTSSSAAAPQVGSSAPPTRDALLKGLSAAPIPGLSDFSEAVGYVLGVAEEEGVGGGAGPTGGSNSSNSSSSKSGGPHSHPLTPVIKCVEDLMYVSEELSEEAAEDLAGLSSLVSTCKQSLGSTASSLSERTLGYLPPLTPPPSPYDLVLPSAITPDSLTYLLSQPYGGLISLMCVDREGGGGGRALDVAKAVVEFLAILARWSQGAEPVIATLRTALNSLDTTFHSGGGGNGGKVGGATTTTKAPTSPARSPSRGDPSLSLSLSHHTSSSSSSSAGGSTQHAAKQHRSLLELSREETLAARARAAAAEGHAAAINTAASLAVAGALSYAASFRAKCVGLGEAVVDVCQSTLSTQARVKGCEEVIGSLHRDLESLRGARCDDAVDALEGRKAWCQGVLRLRESLGGMMASLETFVWEVEGRQQRALECAQEAEGRARAREKAVEEASARLVDREVAVAQGMASARALEEEVSRELTRGKEEVARVLEKGREEVERVKGELERERDAIEKQRGTVAALVAEEIKLKGEIEAVKLATEASLARQRTGGGGGGGGSSLTASMLAPDSHFAAPTRPPPTPAAAALIANARLSIALPPSPFGVASRLGSSSANSSLSTPFPPLPPPPPFQSLNSQRAQALEREILGAYYSSKK